MEEKFRDIVYSRCNECGKDFVAFKEGNKFCTNGIVYNLCDECFDKVGPVPSPDLLHQYKKDGDNETVVAVLEEQVEAEVVVDESNGKPKVSLDEFRAYIVGQCNIGIYVWGGNGELLSDIDEDWIARKEENKKQRKLAIALYRQRKGIAGARAQDCSGYAMGFLMAHGWGDMTANGLKGCCTSCSRSELRDGDFCFKVKKGEAKHIGYYFGGKIYSAKGRKCGCVDNETGWNAYGHFNYYI